MAIIQRLCVCCGEPFTQFERTYDVFEMLCVACEIEMQESGTDYAVEEAAIADEWTKRTGLEWRRIVRRNQVEDAISEYERFIESQGQG